MLFTYGMILVNSSGVQLQLADTGVDVSELGVVLTIVKGIGGNPPVVKLLCKFDHVNELSVWASEYGLEPFGHWAGWYFFGWEGVMDFS
jgi:hypothetical protein